MVFLSDGKSCELNKLPKLWDSGNVIRDNLDYRYHGKSFISLWQIVTNVAIVLQHRLTVHSIGIGGEKMETLAFLAKAVNALGSRGLFSSPQNIAAAPAAPLAAAPVLVGGRSGGVAVAAGRVGGGGLGGGAGGGVMMSTLGDTFTSILQQHTVSSG